MFNTFWTHFGYICCACLGYFLMPSRQGVYTPSRAVPTLSQHEFDMQRTAPRESPQEHGQDFGRRPQHSCRPPEGSLQEGRGLKFLHPRPTQTPEGHACSQGPSLVTQSTPIGSQGPFQAGGQAPPFHRVTKSRQGESKGIPGLNLPRQQLPFPL